MTLPGNKAFTISKTATVADGTADKAGDLVNYTIVATGALGVMLTVAATIKSSSAPHVRCSPQKRMTANSAARCEVH